jgi:hypothetical protein
MLAVARLTLICDLHFTGLNPAWNEVLFFKIFVPELAFVSFTILAKNVFVAQYTIPYRCVQQGRRQMVHLFHFIFKCESYFCFELGTYRAK